MPGFIEPLLDEIEHLRGSSVDLGNTWDDVLRWHRNQMPKQYDTTPSSEDDMTVQMLRPQSTELITQTTPYGNKIVHKGLLGDEGVPYGYVTPNPTYGAVDYGTWHEKHMGLGDRAREALGIPLVENTTPTPSSPPSTGLLGADISANPYYTDPYAFNPENPAVPPVIEPNYPNLYTPPDYWNDYMDDPYGTGQIYDPYTGQAYDPYGNQFYSGYDPYQPSLVYGYDDYNSYGPVSSETEMSTDIYGNPYYAPSDLGTTP